MFKAPAFKVGNIVRIDPAQFDSTGLPDSARGTLKVFDYDEPWHSQFQYEVTNDKGEHFTVQEYVLVKVTGPTL